MIEGDASLLNILKKTMECKPKTFSGLSKEESAKISVTKGFRPA